MSTFPSVDKLIADGQVKIYPDGAICWIAGNRYLMHQGTYFTAPPQAIPFEGERAKSAGRKGGMHASMGYKIGKIFQRK